MFGWLLRLPFRLLYSLVQLLVGRTSSVRALNGENAASTYLQALEKHHGSDHVPLSQTSYAATVEKAKRELKFLMVILTSEVHDDTPAMQALMCDPLLRSYIIDHDILVWAGNVAESEAYSVSRSLRVGRYPFVGLVVYDSTVPSSMACITKLEGVPSTIEMMSCIAEALEIYGPTLISIRADRQEQNTSRSIRAEQDSAYEASLRKDREKAEKDRAEREERNRAEIALNEKKRNIDCWRHMKRRTMPQEPASSKDVARISFRMPDGTRVIRKFASNTPIEDVYTWVDLHLNPADDHSTQHSASPADDYRHIFTFTLAVPMPRQVLEPGTQLISEHKQIFPSGSLVVEEISQENQE